MEGLTRAWDGTPREQALVWELRKDRRVARCALWSHPLGWEVRITVDGELLRSQAHRHEESVLRELDESRAQFVDKRWRPIVQP